MQWRALGAADWQTVRTIANGSGYQVLDLANNTTYEWRVRLICAPDQVGDWSAVSTFRTICPKPTELTVPEIGTNQALVQWLGATAQTDYVLEWRRVGDQGWKEEYVTSSGYADFLLTGLTNQATYEWRVQGVCTDGGRSEVVNGPSFTTKCPLPKQLYVEVVTPLQARVRWANSEDDARFDLRWKASSSTTWTEINDLNTTAYVFTSLSVGSSYDWQVRRHCPDGSRTAFVSGPTIVVNCTASNVTVSAVTPTAARVQWSTPVGFTGTYNFEWSEGGSSFTLIPGLNTTSYALTNLQPNKTYQVRVSTVCAPGIVGTNSTSFMTTCAPPVISYAPTGPTWVTPHWTIPDQSTPHELQWRPLGASDWNTLANLPSGIHTLEDLTPGQSYELRVRRQCTPDVYTDYSAIRVVIPGCMPPTTAVAQVSGTEAEITWGTGSTGLYELQWRPQGTESFSTVTGLSTARYTLTNLQPNTTYEWRLGSVCAANIPPTSYLTRTFSTSCPVPQNVLATVMTGALGTVGLNWTGALNASYRVERQALGDSDWVIVPNLPTQPSVSFTDLAPNKTYQFRVTTVCPNAGESSPVVSNTVALPCPIPTYAYSARQTATSVWLQLPPSGNVNISGYEVRWRSTYGEPAEWQSRSASTDGLFYLSDLTTNSSYEYQVRTVCGAVGSSAYSASRTLYVGCQKPTISSPTPTPIINGSAALQWIPRSTVGTFEIQYRKLGELPWATISTTQSGSYTLTNTTPNTMYEWRVRGMCTDGQWSEYSDPQTLSPPDYARSRHVVNRKEDLLNQTTAKLSWEGRGDGISSFEIRIRPALTTSWGEPMPVSSQSLVLTNLQPGMSYNWQIRWVSASGERGPWEYTEFFAMICPRFSFSRVSPAGANSFTLQPYNTDSWNEPTAGLLRYRTGSDDWQTVPINSLTMVLTGLQPSSTYQYQTQRLCASGDRSEWTESTEMTAACQASVEALVLNPTLVRFSVLNPQTLPVSVQVRRLGTSVWESISLNTNSYDKAGLQPGTVYEWRVLRTCYPPGLTNFAVPQQFVTRCPVPPAPALIARTATSADVRWPADQGAMTVQWRKVGQTDWQTASGVQSPYLATGLLPGQGYQFRLRSLCADGLTNSGISAETYFQATCPAGAYYGTNGVVTAPAAQSVTSNSVQIVWSGKTPGSDVSFTLRWRPFGQLAWNETSISTPLYELTNLTGNTTYEWQIMGDCGTGGQTAADRATFRTLPDRSGFYTILPGDWTDPGIWSGAALPTSTDRTQIRHVVTVLPYLPAQSQAIQFDNGGGMKLKGKVVMGQ
ncbi:hypothetical protein F5984_18590 [Rudanella paleaurantiibacter]|uniref:Fibronectin type-III domain-containing protein n=1 Tax=Rudanella paleaurantiibacter TaxID=2614655 RepID=A0A7J5TXT3_9BACT|nr:fibronectin type III domain-containing protein [Rudanella paleaurantiibacter]KAB7728381.1 hypothetical protein F5984_18590 [Rudanella paleaurantiibacter]